MPFFHQDKSKPGDKHARRGLQAIDADDYHAAIYELELALQLDVGHYGAAELYTVLGKAYERIDDYDKSIAACQKALELKPDYHPAWNNLGIAYYYLGQFDESERCHRRAISLRPDYAAAHVSLGAVYIGREQPQKAVEALRQAIVLNPRMGSAYGNLALAQAMLGQYDEAAVTLKQAITFGYKNWREVRERIEALKAYEQMQREEDDQFNKTNRDAGTETPWFSLN